MKKRMLSLLLILAMLVSLMPVSTAVEYEPAPPEITIPVTFYDMSVPSRGTKSNPDFESSSALDAGFQTGLVKTTLGLDGTPDFLARKNSITESSFEQWFSKANPSGSNPGNIEIVGKTLTLSKTSDSPVKYAFSNSAFFPLDGTGDNQQGFGHQGRSHNYHFTMKFSTTFTYQEGQEFSFTGDDDVWVFINKQLVIDLGGVHAERNASVDLDTLGLTPGQVYSFDLFFAERHTTESNFKMETSIELDEVPVITYDLTATVNEPTWGKVIKTGTTPEQNPSGTYEENTDVAVKAVAFGGYYFDYWTGDVPNSDINDPTITVNMSTNKSIQAVFAKTPVYYNLTLIADPVGGGSIGAAPAPQASGSSYLEDTEVTLTATENAGFRFAGWDSQNAPDSVSEDNEKEASVTMNSHRTVKAFFVALWDLEAETDGNGTVSAKIGNTPLAVPANDLDDGTDVVLTATPAEGYKIKGWTVNGTPQPTLADSMTVTMDKDISVYVAFEPMEEYTLTTKVSPEGAGEITAVPNKLTFREDDEDKTVQLTQQENDGWTFSRWEVVTDAAITAPLIETGALLVTVNANKTATAYYNRNYYPLTLTIQGEGTVGVNPAAEGMYEHGTIVALTPVAATGWRFAGYAGTNGGDVKSDAITMNGAKNVTAVFEPIQVQLVLEWTTGGSASANPAASEGMYDYGTIVTVSAEAATGYSFKEWAGANAEELDNNKIVMNGNKVLRAVFEKKAVPVTPTPVPTTPTPSPTTPTQILYTLTISKTGNGSLSPAEGTHTAPANAFFQMTEPVPEEGWVFSGWEGTNGTEVTQDGIVMTGNKEIIAVFELIPTEEETPQAAPEVVTPTPEAPVDELVEEIVLEEPVPLDTPVLPKTSGLPLSLLIGFGGLLTAGGIKIRKQNKR